MKNMNRRRFLQSAFQSSLLYGVGAAPFVGGANTASAAPLDNRLLINLFLDGGTDFRHLIVPEYDSAPDSFGAKYWKHRARSHRLGESLPGFGTVTAQQRWNDDYYPITVGGSRWTSNLTDIGGRNSGVTFGIWREAGWLIDMFRSGNVALISNAVGGTNQAHDLCALMLHQGNVLTRLNYQDRSGWGGRLARSAGRNVLSVQNAPNPFCFGPVGDAPNYNVNAIDNSDLLSVNDARSIGLHSHDLSEEQLYDSRQKMLRAAQNYYAALQNEQIDPVYEKILDHEFKTRELGILISERLETVPIPKLITALYSEVASINSGRPVLNDRYSFGSQIRNVYDLIAANDLLRPGVMSMRYGGWDSHADQRIVPAGLSSDLNNSGFYRGIESGFRDIFGGRHGNNPSSPGALHNGFSALWKSLPSQADRNNIVITLAGEFGRQIRDNGDHGTDHGSGNMMMVISERCNGGLYGSLFPDSEVDKYDDSSLTIPDIEPQTEFDHIFAAVSDWVSPGSSGSVFPRTAAGYSGPEPIIEVPGMFNSLFS